MKKQAVVLLTIVLFSLLSWGLSFISSGQDSDASRNAPNSLWTLLGCIPEDIHEIQLVYHGHPMTLLESDKAFFIDALSSTSPKKTEDTHVYDKSEYEVIIKTKSGDVSPLFCWFSGRKLDPAFPSSAVYISDNRLDISIDGKKYFHFQFSSPEKIWDEYMSRKAYDNAAKAVGRPCRGNLDGFDSWTDSNQRESYPMMYQSWQAFLDRMDVIAIGTYSGRIRYTYSRSINPISYSSEHREVGLFSTDKYLKGSSEFNQIIDTTHTGIIERRRGVHADLFTSADIPTNRLIRGTIPSVDELYDFSPGTTYLICAGAYTSYRDNVGEWAEQIVYAAYPIDNGKIYPWYNTELELFNGTPLEEVEAYLAAKAQQ